MEEQIKTISYRFSKDTEKELEKFSLNFTRNFLQFPKGFSKLEKCYQNQYNLGPVMGLY